MAEKTKIEWCDATFNPWVGCQKVSPGCDHCYAEGWSKRSGQVQWGPHGERKRTSEANWRQPFSWARKARADGIRRRVFCASLADWLDNKAPHAWRLDLAMLIEATPELDWLLLTKRIENFEKHSPWESDELPRNVWLGITCEDQERFNRRWNILKKIPATVRFISYEPAIGPLRLPGADPVPDWLICGGESGHGARMMDPEWARLIRKDCLGERVAFFMKQMTSKAPIPNDLLIREFPRGVDRAPAITAHGTGSNDAQPRSQNPTTNLDR